jgi:hypothetical protein
MKRILVCGGREYANRTRVYQILDAVKVKYPELLIIQGDCRGADRMAGDWATSRKVPMEVYPALWEQHGKSAGPKRNQQMLDTGIDAGIAFHSNIAESRGTADMVRRLKKAGLPVWILD